MTLSVAHLQPIVALIAGVLILLVPRILNYVVAIYLNRHRPSRTQHNPLLSPCRTWHGLTRRAR